MNTWSVVLAEESEVELNELSPLLKRKFDIWVLQVQVSGPWLSGGWRTEALVGGLAGFYSVRLNRKWRVIFEFRSERRIVVIRIMAHDYRSIRRK